MGMRERFTGKHALNIYTRFYSRMFREHEIIQPHLMYITRFLSDPIDDSKIMDGGIYGNFFRPAERCPFAKWPLFRNRSNTMFEKR